MVAADNSKTLVTIYQTTRRYILEGRHINIHSCENLYLIKFYILRTI
jgi:hypothetical protein